MFQWEVITFLYALVSTGITSFVIGIDANKQLSVKGHLYDFNTSTESWTQFERRHFKRATVRYFFSISALVGIFISLVLTTFIFLLSSVLIEKVMSAVQNKRYSLFPSDFHYHFTIGLYVFLSIVTCWIVAVSKVGVARSYYNDAWMERKEAGTPVK